MNIVVTGATGNVGRPLVAALAAAGHEVTAMARGRRPGAHPSGVRTVRADLTRPSDLAEPFGAAEAVFLLTSPDFLASGGDLGRVVETAGAAGVKRVVLLSAQGVATGRHPSTLEDVVTRSALAWTVLRSGGFASNALRWAPGIRSQGTVTAPFGDVVLPVVDPRDIADVAAVALTRDGHAGEVYELTGPEAITPREQAAAIAAAAGKTVEFVEQTPDEARRQMAEYMPARAVEATLGVLGDPTPREQRISPEVETVLGRRPRTFAQWAEDHREAFGRA